MPDRDDQFLLNSTGQEVALLQEALGALGYELPATELSARRYGLATAGVVRELATQGAEWRSGLLDEPAERALREAVAAAADMAMVSGRIVFEHGLAAGRIAVRAYNRGFGGEATILADGATEDDGAYALGYPLDGRPVNLEIRALDRAQQEVSLSEPKFGAGVDETMNLVAPESVRPLEPEYVRLAADLERALGSPCDLARAQEGDGERDLSIVAAATGWDARLLALAATAEKMSAETKVPAEALYALFRGGLPTDADELFRAPPKLVDQAWRKGVAAGIVKGGNGIAEARDAFRNHARTAFRDAKASGALSSFGELLAVAELPPEEQAAWEDAYLSGVTGPQLWTAARKKGVSAESIEKLKLQGKLAQLTLNNAPLAAALQPRLDGENGTAALVDEGLYGPGAWKDRLSTLATNGTQLQELIPPAYEGERTEDRLDAYASDMARKVRLAFPTHVVGHMLETGDLPLEGGRSVGALLRKAAVEGFELGRTPVDAFFRAKRKTLLGSEPAGSADGSLEAVRRISRLYQITPGNDAMKTLLAAGFDSAQDVVVVDRDRFVSRHGAALGADAALVHDKAMQVASTSQAVVASARVLDSPPIRALGGSEQRMRELIAAAKKTLVKHYPTMEQLFGSLDFCECEHCRSVLGPAAYLVALLRFLDPKSPGWEHFVTEWNGSHSAKFGPGGHYDKPFHELTKRRRPDIPNLPLTCENTNTLLPYIDLVNEILEYNVAHQTYAGHDTGEATTEQLLAEPQYVLPQAYTTLGDAHYPLGLPFDLWLETVRQYLARLEVPLWQLLETFRATDELFRPPHDMTPYFRSQVFAESLGLSPSEWALFTRGATGSWWDLYGYKSALEAETELVSAKTLARRLGVSYRELTELVRTSFVNPGLAELVLLSKVGIGLDEVYAFKNHGMTDAEQVAFGKTLQDFKQRTGFDAKKWLDERYADGTLSRALVLAAPTVECNFDQTRFVYADGTKATAVDFVKLNLFVRLWKKLGWTIGELDHALTALVPPGELPLKSKNLGRALGAALIYLAHLNTLAGELPEGAAARVELAALWADISTRGKGSLYAQHFLTPTVLRDDPVFDEPTGKYLSRGNVHLADHRGAVQAALTLTASELERIAADAGLALASAPLSIATLSTLYRYRLLARALDISIDDLITLKSLSGLDPFISKRGPLKQLAAKRSGGTPSPLADDLPFTQTIRFVEIARLVTASAFTIEELDYLLRHRLDPVGPFRSEPRVLFDRVVQLGAGITRIRSENAAPDDPAALDDETLRQKLSLVLSADDVETFMGMWRGTIQYEAVPKDVAPANALDPDQPPFDPATKPFASEVAVAYDAGRQRQRLSVTGVLIQKRTDELAPNAGLLRSLLTDVQGQARRFATDHLAGLFPETRNGNFSNVEDLFEPVPSAPSDARVVLARKRRRIVDRLFPFVQQQLIRQLIVASRASAVDADPPLVEALLTDPTLLADPRWPAASLLEGFAAAADVGATASFYPTTDGTGAATSTKLVVEVDTKKKPQSGFAHSASLEGLLEPAATGSHTFFVHVDDPGTRVELRFSHLPDPVVAATAAAANFEPSAAVDLTAGVPYEFTLDVQALAAGDVSVLVETKSMPKGSLSRLRLHPAASVERVRRTDVLLTKSLRLLTGFALDEREARHFVATQPAGFASLSLSALPTSLVPAATAAASFRWFLRLAEYSALKGDLNLTGSDLIDVFENARHAYDPAVAPPAAAEAALLTDIQSHVGRLLRRTRELVGETADALGFGAKADAANLWVEAPEFAQEQGLRRLWDALRTVEKLGVSAAPIRRWTGIVDPAGKNRDEIAKDLRNALKARFSDEAWPAVVQPVSDELRRRKRDALVAYVLADPRHDFQNPDELYEYFLVDPATEPVVQTSRLELAISSVQLFVQRCLLNLEPRVPAAVIDAEEWQWMKRYRLWEANRKIFLYPENWLEPEFRDDKTHLFRELERSVLQGEVSNDAAEDAFLTYLNGLEQIARLQIVSMYAEEHGETTTLHVIGRTFATPHKYYYRRFANDVWSPWEPVAVEIEGDHVDAVFWHGRLHLFWLTFQERSEVVTDFSPVSQTKPGENASLPDALKAVASGLVGELLGQSTPVQQQARHTLRRKVEIRLHWSDYIDGAWTPPSAPPSTTLIEHDIPDALNPATFFTWVSKEPTTDGTEGAVYVHVLSSDGFKHQFTARFRIASKHSAPTVESTDEFGGPMSPEWRQPPADWYSALGYNATRRDPGGFGILYSLKSGATIVVGVPSAYDVLLADDELTRPQPDPGAFGPFFYQDERHTFFVRPAMTGGLADSNGWVLDPSRTLPAAATDALVVEAAVPDLHIEPAAAIDPRARFAVRPTSDWLTGSDTGIAFDNVVVQREGGDDETLRPPRSLLDGPGRNGHADPR